MNRWTLRAWQAALLVAVFEGLPTSIITRHEVVELSVVFVGLGALLVVTAIGLSQMWRPLP